MRARLINLVLFVLGQLYCAFFMPREVARYLRQMQGLARSTGVAKADHTAIYRHVRRRKPRILLELGAGQSSGVIALAMPAGARFLAVEEDEAWLAHHRTVMPTDLRDKIEWLRAETEATDVGGARAARYVGLPRLAYEFVHIDGPDIGKLNAAVSCDIIDLLPHLAPSCLVVFDGREASARLARPHLEAAGFRLRRHPFTLSHEFVR
jgi:predicted O-methyltransferase YrrM